MSELRRLFAALAVAVSAAVCGSFTVLAEGPHAEPRRVSRQEHAGDEQRYLADVHRIAPNLGKSDSQLIADGWKACAYRRAGHESINLPDVAGAEAAWALTDLCPEIGDF